MSNPGPQAKAAEVLCVWDAEARCYAPVTSHRGVALSAQQAPTQFPHGAPISKTGGKHQVDGFFAGEIDWKGEKHPVMAIPVRVGWMLHIYAPGQLVARESGGETKK